MFSAWPKFVKVLSNNKVIMNSTTPDYQNQPKQLIMLIYF